MAANAAKTAVFNPGRLNVVGVFMLFTVFFIVVVVYTVVGPDERCRASKLGDRLVAGYWPNAVR